MGYRAQLMEMLQALGERIRKVDDAYAEKVRSAIIPVNPDGSVMSVARSVGGAMAGAPLTHGLPQVSADAGLGERAMAAAVPVTAVTARYALPAAGVTLAGKGLYDLSYALGAALRPEDEEK